MVISCKNFLTYNGNEDIRNLSYNVVIERLNAVWKLYDYYKQEYLSLKHKSRENNSETPINLSEIYIFGKFEALSLRLHKV
jgi:hypothetical protein